MFIGYGISIIKEFKKKRKKVRSQGPTFVRLNSFILCVFIRMSTPDSFPYGQVIQKAPSSYVLFGTVPWEDINVVTIWPSCSVFRGSTCRVSRRLLSLSLLWILLSTEKEVRKVICCQVYILLVCLHNIAGFYLLYIMFQWRSLLMEASKSLLLLLSIYHSLFP